MERLIEKSVEKMSRMMPGRIRQEGIELYEQGQLSVEKVDGQELLLRIAGEDFTYDMDEKNLFCSCQLFAQRGYCQHLAATEYFLKNDAEAKKLLEQIQTNGQKEQETKQRNYFGGLFLDNILGPLEPKLVKYRLAAEGSLGTFDKQIDWTLKISRLPDQRTYIIRDIGAFLKILEQGGYYQIGRNYYEPISYEEFDGASQDLIDFLWRMVPEKNLISNEILVNFGRSLRFPWFILKKDWNSCRGSFSSNLIIASQPITAYQSIPMMLI